MTFSERNPDIFRAAEVGYFAFSGFDTDRTPNEKCGKSKEALPAGEYDYYIRRGRRLNHNVDSLLIKQIMYDGMTI